MSIRNVFLTALFAALLVAATVMQAQAYTAEASQSREASHREATVGVPTTVVRRQVQTYDPAWDAAPLVFGAPLGGHVE